MVLVLFANTNFKMYLLRVLSLIQELRFNVSVSVSMSGWGTVGLGVGWGATSRGIRASQGTFSSCIQKGSKGLAAHVI